MHHSSKFFTSSFSPNPSASLSAQRTKQPVMTPHTFLVFQLFTKFSLQMLLRLINNAYFLFLTFGGFNRFKLLLRHKTVNNFYIMKCSYQNKRALRHKMHFIWLTIQCLEGTKSTDGTLYAGALCENKKNTLPITSTCYMAS